MRTIPKYSPKDSGSALRALGLRLTGPRRLILEVLRGTESHPAAEFQETHTMAGKSLKGTKSHENLKEAFAGESQANRRYLCFARVAGIEGFPDMAGLFQDNEGRAPRGSSRLTDKGRMGAAPHPAGSSQ